jgi:2-oxoglutarate dehydrogenase complex dehydrogenase (E1) component-like enzyme
MKITDLTKEQKEELDKFGANTWFVEYLHKLYEENPSELPEQWRSFFSGESNLSSNGNGYKTAE